MQACGHMKHTFSHLHLQVQQLLQGQACPCLSCTCCSPIIAGVTATAGALHAFMCMPPFIAPAAAAAHNITVVHRWKATGAIVLCMCCSVYHSPTK